MLINDYFINHNIKSKIHLVNRLDKLTSGLVIVAKNQYIHNLFAKTKINKRYYALVEGNINIAIETDEFSLSSAKDVKLKIGLKDISVTSINAYDFDNFINLVNKVDENNVLATIDELMIALDELKNINLDILSGEFVFITGESGCGKSTLVKMLYREEKPTEGSILVGGLDVAKIKRAPARRTLSVTEEILFINNQGSALLASPQL